MARLGERRGTYVGTLLGVENKNIKYQTPLIKGWGVI